MKNKIALLTATLAVAGLAQVANATSAPGYLSFIGSNPGDAGLAGLYLYDTATLTGAFAAANANGQATFAGTVGDYSVNISATGTTLAGGANPVLDLDVANAQAGAGATTLQVFYSDGAFGPTAGGYDLKTLGPQNGNITTTAYANGSVFGTTTTLLTEWDNGGVTDVSGQGNLPSGTFFLTIGDVITGSESSVDTRLSVPDGGATMMLLGMGLSGIALLRKKITA